MANSDLGQFGPRPLVNSDPIKTRSEFPMLFLKIGFELAKDRIEFRSELTKVQNCSIFSSRLFFINLVNFICDCSTRIMLDLVRNPEDRVFIKCSGSNKSVFTLIIYLFIGILIHTIQNSAS